ncbi:MAG TPA: hypothetical protein VIX37_10585, partial [Candidatus Sulfotelmatobacter sp.]
MCRIEESELDRRSSSFSFAGISAFGFSENHFQAELNLPGTGDRAEDAASVARQDTASLGIGRWITVGGSTDKDCVTVTTSSVGARRVVGDLK